MKINQILASVVLLSLLFISCPVSGEENGVIGGDMGIYRVHCNVDGAQVYFDVELMGVISDGLLNIPVYTTGTPYRTYAVEKAGYRTYSGPINSVPAKGEVFHIYVTLSAMPPVQYGRIHVLATPALSDVALDNKPAGKVSESGILIIYDVLPGEHRIEVTKEGYTSYTSSVYVGPNDIVKLPVTLEPVKYGVISITSTPAGADVYLDDQFRGVTPIELQEVSLGIHEVRLELTGYQPYSRSVQVSGGATSELQAELVPVPVTQSGELPLGVIPIAGALAASFLLAGARKK